jgi:Flp pilus assembly protein TadG
MKEWGISINWTSPDELLVGFARAEYEDEDGNYGVMTSLGFLFFTIDLCITTKVP